ncbi:unnamed protein product, partial [Medioppia subpectinata]
CRACNEDRDRKLSAGSHTLINGIIGGGSQSQPAIVNLLTVQNYNECEGKDANHYTLVRTWTQALPYDQPNGGNTIGVGANDTLTACPPNGPRVLYQLESLVNTTYPQGAYNQLENLYLVKSGCGPLQGKYVYLKSIVLQDVYLKVLSSQLGLGYTTTNTAVLLISDILNLNVFVSPVGAYDQFRKGCTTVCKGTGFTDVNVAVQIVTAFSGSNSEQNLIVISFDGFRNDFVSRELTPNLYRLADNGVRGHMISNFVTKTYPNHQSIATGFYVENHGIVHNEFFDPKHNRVFRTNKQLPDYWWTEFPVTPVWTANQLYGRSSGVMQWPGGHVKYKNQTVRHYQPYDSHKRWDKRMDTIVHWMADERSSVNCVFAYFNEPDSTGHHYGPDSDPVRAQVRRVDAAMGRLLSRLADQHLLNRTNVIVLSDHGMTEVKQKCLMKMLHKNIQYVMITLRANRVISLNKYLNPSLYDMYGASPVWSIRAKPGYEDRVYDTLAEASKTQHFKVYKKEALPDRYHYRNNRRILPIFLMADEGWDVDREMRWRPKGWPVWGNHGWDNRLPSMRPLFIASGPAFKRRYVHNGVFMNSDLFPLMLQILGLPVKRFPCDGSLDSVADMLAHYNIDRQFVDKSKSVFESKEDIAYDAIERLENLKPYSWKHTVCSHQENKSKPETKDSDSKPSGSGEGGKTATDGKKSSQVKVISSTDSTDSLAANSGSKDSKKSTDGEKSSANSGSSDSGGSSGSGAGAKAGSEAKSEAKSGADAKAGTGAGSGAPAAATPDNRCPICMDPIAEPARGNQCNHRCCTACLQEWANQHANCPVCRQPITEIWTNIRPDGGHDTRPVVRQNVMPFVPQIVPRRGRYRPPRPPPPVRNPRLNYHRLGYYWRRGVLCRLPRRPEEMEVARHDAWLRGRRSWREMVATIGTRGSAATEDRVGLVEICLAVGIAGCLVDSGREDAGEDSAPLPAHEGDGGPEGRVAGADPGAVAPPDDDLIVFEQSFFGLMSSIQLPTMNGVMRVNTPRNNRKVADKRVVIFRCSSVKA